MSTTYDKLIKLHDLLVEQVLADVENGDVAARHIAVVLLKNSSISAVPTQENLYGKLASKLDFSSMQAKLHRNAAGNAAHN